MAVEKVVAATSPDTKEIGEAGSDDVEHQTPPVAGSAFEVRLSRLMMMRLTELPSATSTYRRSSTSASLCSARGKHSP